MPQRLPVAAPATARTAIDSRPVELTVSCNVGLLRTCWRPIDNATMGSFDVATVRALTAAHQRDSLPDTRHGRYPCMSAAVVAARAMQGPQALRKLLEGILPYDADERVQGLLHELDHQGRLSTESLQKTSDMVQHIFGFMDGKSGTTLPEYRSMIQELGVGTRPSKSHTATQLVKDDLQPGEAAVLTTDRSFNFDDGAQVDQPQPLADYYRDGFEAANPLDASRHRDQYDRVLGGARRPLPRAAGRHAMLVGRTQQGQFYTYDSERPQALKMIEDQGNNHVFALMFERYAIADGLVFRPV